MAWISKNVRDDCTSSNALSWILRIMISLARHCGQDTFRDQLEEREELAIAGMHTRRLVISKNPVYRACIYTEACLCNADQN